MVFSGTQVVFRHSGEKPYNICTTQLVSSSVFKMNGFLEWVPAYLGSQYKRVERPVRPVFSDYLSVSYDYDLIQVAKLNTVSKRNNNWWSHVKINFKKNCGILVNFYSRLLKQDRDRGSNFLAIFLDSLTF